MHRRVEPSHVSPPSSDSQLMVGLLAGNHEALMVLHGRYAELVFSIALRVLKNESDADDVVQEVFLALWNHPERFSPERGSGVGAWLAVCSRHRAVDVLRKKYRRAEAPLEDCGTWKHAVEMNTIIACEEIRSCCKTMGAEVCAIFTLAFEQGMTHVEISEYLGQPLGTVKTRLRTALAVLRDSVKSTKLTSG